MDLFKKKFSYFLITFLVLISCSSKQVFKTSPSSGREYYHGFVYVSFEENGFLFLDVVEYSKGSLFPFHMLLKIDWEKSRALSDILENHCKKESFVEIKFSGSVSRDNTVVIEQVFDYFCTNELPISSHLNEK